MSSDARNATFLSTTSKFCPDPQLSSLIARKAPLWQSKTLPYSVVYFRTSRPSRNSQLFYAHIKTFGTSFFT